MPINLMERLKVELDGYVSYNLLANHSGNVGGTTGWTSGSGVTLSAVTDAPAAGSYGGRAVKSALTAAVAYQNNVVRSPAIVPAKDGYATVAFSLQTVAAIAETDKIVYAVSVERAPAGATNPTWTSQNGEQFTNVATLRPGQNPALTELVLRAIPFWQTTYQYRLAVNVIRYPLAQGTNPYTTNDVAIYLSRVFLASTDLTPGPTTDTWRALGARFHDAAGPQNVIGSHNRITIQRGVEQDGATRRLRPTVATANIRDAALDPVTNAKTRPNRAVRVRAYSGLDGKWYDLANLKIDTLDVEYGQGRPSIDLVANDDVQRIAAQPARTLYPFDPNNQNKGGAYGFDQLMAGLGGAGVNVAYFADETAGTDPRPSTADVDPDYTITNGVASNLDQFTWGQDLLDQLHVLAESSYAFLWSDWQGAIRFAAPSKKPSASPAWTLTDRNNDGSTNPVYYTDLKLGFGSRDLINAVLVNKVNPFSEAVDEGAKTYGPYTLAASVIQWGQQTAEVPIIFGDPKAKAVAVTKMYGEAKRAPSEITFDALANEEAFKRALTVEVYQAVRVRHAPTSTDTTVRVLSIRHDIAAARKGGATWRVTLTLAPLETDPTVVLQNPVGGAAAGPDDLVSPQIGPVGSRYLANDLSIPSQAAVTSVAWDTGDLAIGITYDTTNRRFTVSKDGRYLVVAQVQWYGRSGGYRGLVFLINGAGGKQRIDDSGTATPITANIQTIRPLKAGDTIAIAVAQTSGSALSLIGGGRAYVDLAYLGA